MISEYNELLAYNEQIKQENEAVRERNRLRAPTQEQGAFFKENTKATPATIQLEQEKKPHDLPALTPEQGIFAFR